MQVRELRDYCPRRGWEVAGEYVNVGVTGAKEQRPELDWLLAECQKPARVRARSSGLAQTRRAPQNRKLQNELE